MQKTTQFLQKVQRVLLKYVGWRTLKTTLAVLISALFMRYVVNDTPFFACIGAVAAMEKTMPDSYRAAIVRNVGTLVGGLLGILFAKLTDNVVLLGLGIIPHIIIHNILNKRESIVLGSIVYFAVVYSIQDSMALSYGLRRIAETFLGTLIALAINRLISPPKAAQPVSETEQA